MSRIRRQLPSAAMLVAIVALIAALGGTAVAGGVLTKKKFRNQALRGPVTYVSNFASIPLTPGATNPGINVAAYCPPGAKVIGGGIRLGNDAVQFVNDSHPIVNGWGGTVYNTGSISHGALTFAICATAKSSTGALPTS